MDGRKKLLDSSPSSLHSGIIVREHLDGLAQKSRSPELWALEVHFSRCEAWFHHFLFV